jgi:HK97 family phage prohead protease
MPWKPADAADHVEGLSPHQATVWARVANAVLARCLEDGGSQEACEGRAIRQANAAAQRAPEKALDGSPAGAGAPGGWLDGSPAGAGAPGGWLDGGPVERKSFAAQVTAAPPAEGGAPEGLVEAVVAVFSNVDAAREVITPGAFAKSLRAKLPKGVWGHDWSQPVARTEEARELLPGDPLLPEGLRDLGGLYIKGRFNLGTQRGREAYSDLAFGIVDEFSIGYRVVRARRVTEAGDEVEEAPGAPVPVGAPGEKGVRYLDELALYEWSPVLVGMNPATALLAVKGAAGAPDDPPELAALDRALKEGRVLSAANRRLIASLIEQLQALLAAAEPKPKSVDAAPLFVAYQRTLARLNGVAA